MTDCMDMMDILEQTTKTNSQSTHSLTKSKQILQRGRMNSLSSQRSANKSNKSITQNSEYVDIAYSQQIKKVRKLSVTSLSSTSSLQSSFQKMEQRMKKNRTPTPEMIDQKYMISGYLQMSKDYKNLILTLKSFLQTLRGVLQYGTGKVKEDKILEVDQYFEKHSGILRTKVRDYFQIKESLHRFIRMKIQEPYYRRVMKKIKQIEKTNNIFELFRIYLEAFDFIKFKGFDSFKEDLDLMKQLQKPPNNNKIGQSFNEQIIQIRKQIECTKDFKEGDILSKVFEYKINQILEWEELLIRLMSFRYLFNVKYNLNGGLNSRKIIKSKKLYEELIQQQEDINKFLVDNFAMNQIYLEQLSQLQDDLELMKNQIIQWNIKLKNDQYFNKILQIVKFNILLKKSLKQIDNIIQIQNTKQYNQKYKIRATDIVVQIKIEHQKIKELLKYYGKSKEIEQDEYLQKQYNKSIIQYNYFMDLKGDLEQ